MSIRKKTIGERLKAGEHSHNTSLEAVISDWFRAKNYFFINDKPVNDYLKFLNIDTDNELDSTNPVVQAKFIEIFKLLIPDSPLLKNNEQIMEQVLNNIHQGALPYLMQSKLTLILNDYDYSLANRKEGITQRIDFKSSPTGFTVTETFSYKGGLRDFEGNELFDSKNKPLVQGSCQHEVKIDKEGVNSTLEKYKINTSNQSLHHMLGIKEDNTNRLFKVFKQAFTNTKAEKNDLHHEQPSSYSIKR